MIKNKIKFGEIKWLTTAVSSFHNGTLFVTMIVIMLCLTVHFMFSVHLFLFLYFSPAHTHKGTGMRTIYLPQNTFLTKVELNNIHFEFSFAIKLCTFHCIS